MIGHETSLFYTVFARNRDTDDRQNSINIL